MVTLAVFYAATAISGQLRREMGETRYHDRLLYERSVREQKGKELLAARVERVQQAARECAVCAIWEHVDEELPANALRKAARMQYGWH